VKRMAITVMSSLGIGAVSLTAHAQDAYLVGVSAALTGPLASAYSPVADGMRLYLDKVNAAGGINGKKVQLLIRDDQSEATKGAANVKRLLEQDNVQLLVNDSGSSTYQPAMAEAKRAGMPLLFVGVCPGEVYPPTQPLFFCTNSFASHYDSRAALDFIKEAAGTTDLDLGLMSQTLPIARAEIDYAEVRAKEMNMRPVDKELMSPATADFTPYSTKLNGAKPSWIWGWAAWELQTGVTESLRRLGWTGNFLGWSHIQAEDNLPGLKDPHFYTIGTNSYFFENLPIQQEIVATAKAAGIAYPASRLAEGWIAGMTIEAAFKAVGPSVTSATLATAMDGLTIDTKGLRGTPIEWSKDNHFRKHQSYRVYRWNGEKLEAIGDWRHYDVK
jgi:branched-chain amino acid transport system substrate-binding protein